MTEMSEVAHIEMCRLCLNLSTLNVNVFSNDLVQMIEDLTGVKITPDDNLPHISCLKCIRQVKLAHLIRRRIIQSQTTLSNINSSSFENKNTHVQAPIIKASFIGLERFLNKSLKGKSFDDWSQVNKGEISDNSIPEGANSIFTSAFTEEQNRKIQKLKLSLANKYLTKLNPLKAALTQINRNEVAHESESSNIVKLVQKITNEKNVKPLSKSILECSMCQIKFPNKLKYNRHMNRHKNRVCPICNKTIRSEYLKKHISLHNALPAVCEICGVTRKNQNSLRMHIFYYHKQGLTACKDCGKTFRTKTKLLYHQRKVHTKERDFKCEICGKGFFAKTYLTKHISMRHMKERPEICEYCGKDFSSKHALRTHIRQHTNETPYHCNFCGEGFRQRVSLKGHLKSRHKIEEKNTEFCEICGKGFATDVALEIHMRLHFEIKCPLCSDSFADQSYLDLHIGTNHVEEGLSSSVNDVNC
ncbi:zinc finger protein 260-like [Euwallacea similis]|uniref:zinc finger protein 260-like n=1 Tax=Euwallacea similis TaxID=1736056 RepID=UPI003450E1B3